MRCESGRSNSTSLWNITWRNLLLQTKFHTPRTTLQGSLFVICRLYKDLMAQLRHPRLIRSINAVKFLKFGFSLNSSRADLHGHCSSAASVCQMPASPCSLQPLVIWHHNTFQHVKQRTAVVQCTSLSSAVSPRGKFPPNSVLFTLDMCEILPLNASVEGKALIYSDMNLCNRYLILERKHGGSFAHHIHKLSFHTLIMYLFGAGLY